MTDAFIKRGHGDTDMHTGEMPRDDWNGAATRKELPELRRRPGTRPDLELPASRPVGEEVSVVVHAPVRGALLRQP